MPSSTLKEKNQIIHTKKHHILQRNIFQHVFSHRICYKVPPLYNNHTNYSFKKNFPMARGQLSPSTCTPHECIFWLIPPRKERGNTKKWKEFAILLRNIEIFHFWSFMFCLVAVVVRMLFVGELLNPSRPILVQNLPEWRVNMSYRYMAHTSTTCL